MSGVDIIIFQRQLFAYNIFAVEPIGDIIVMKHGLFGPKWMPQAYIYVKQYETCNKKDYKINKRHDIHLLFWHIFIANVKRCV
jgi:hypothetical protein